MHQHHTGRAVAVIGELNVDLIASGLTSAPILGGEVLAEDFQTVLGSASAIFACGAARLGHPVSFFSKVGDDDYGRFCLTALQKAGISTENVATVPTSKTGITISLSMRTDRALVTVLGAISDLRDKDLDLQALHGHSHLHMTSFFLQTALRPSFPQILRQARKLGLTTSFDPNSDPMSSWGPDVWRVVDETTILFINQEEALHLTRKKNVREALKQLAERAPCVVVKLGPRGAIAAADGQVVSAPPVQGSSRRHNRRRRLLRRRLRPRLPLRPRSPRMPSRRQRLRRSIHATGRRHSRPARPEEPREIPAPQTATPISHAAEDCHPERNLSRAKRVTNGVEGSLPAVLHRRPCKAFP